MIRFLAILAAINIGAALVLGWLLSFAPFEARIWMFIVSAILIFALNQSLGRSMPRFRKLVWGIQALNIASAFFLGALTAPLALRILPMLL